MIENERRRKPAAASRSSHPTEQKSGNLVVSHVDKVDLGCRIGSGAGDRSLSQDVTAWLVSLAVHCSALVGLASLTLLLPIPREEQFTSFPVELSDEALPQDFHFSSDPHEQIGGM